MPRVPKKFFVHKTAIVESNVEIGDKSKVWHFAHVREGTKIGNHCVIGNSVFIDTDSVIGNNVKIQNHAIIYRKAIIEDGVFIGPNVCFTNDKNPRAINPDGSLKSADDWQVAATRIAEGTSIGAHSVILPGVTIGKFALVGAGSVVSKNVPDFALVYGNPAKVKGYVCKCGRKLKIVIKKDRNNIVFVCQCGLVTILERENED